MKPVANKRDFVGRYMRGEFGNRAPTWWDLPDYLDNSAYYRGKVHIRNRVPGGPTWYNIHCDRVYDLTLQIINEGYANSKDLYFSGMAPHSLGTIQGEVRRSERHLELRYNLQKVPMRDGFAVEDLSAFGLTALNLLKANLCANSYDWMQYLLAAYDNHVVEFSSFSTYWGTLPRFNTVFWEVRPDRLIGSNLSPFTEVY